MPAALLLLLQTSLIVSPQYLGPEEPEGRAVRALVVIHADSPGASRALRRGREEALQLARALHQRLARGEDFAQLARRHSDHASARNGGVLGTVWPGMLPVELDAFLFSAGEGEISDVIESATGFHVLQRIERDVAWRQIQVDGSGPEALARCQALIERLRAGEDFGELARAESSDRASAARGGVAGIFQRGPRDGLLKAAAFEARVGACTGPVVTPFASFVLERLPLEQVDPTLRERNAIRARAILVAFTGAAGAEPSLARTSLEAEELARDLERRLRAGEDMAELAAQWNDDPGGRERRGDLGWILRQASSVPAYMEATFTEPVDKLLGPFASDSGWVLLRREL